METKTSYIYQYHVVKVTKTKLLKKDGIHLIASPYYMLDTDDLNLVGAIGW